MTQYSPEDLVQDFRAGKVNRRQLVQRAMALGLSAPALVALLGTGAIPATAVAAQSSGDLKLLTAADEQASTWTRNFNPLLPAARVVAG